MAARNYYNQATSKVSLCQEVAEPKLKPIIEVQGEPVLLVTNYATDSTGTRAAYTNSTRRPIRLSTNRFFRGSGTLTKSKDSIELYKLPSGGEKLAFDGKDNKFNGATLHRGVTLYAEAATPSEEPGDIKLELKLSGLLLGKRSKEPVELELTAVEITLDIGESRKGDLEPTLLSKNGKIHEGRYLLRKNPTRNDLPHERAMLVVKKAKPAGFDGVLILDLLNERLRLFSTEKSVEGEAPIAVPLEIPTSEISSESGKTFWVEGVRVSESLRDTGVLLGLKDVESIADRVNLTVLGVALDMVDDSNPGEEPSVIKRLKRKPYTERVAHGVFRARFAPSTYFAEKSVSWDLVEDPASSLRGELPSSHPNRFEAEADRGHDVIDQNGDAYIRLNLPPVASNKGKVRVSCQGAIAEVDVEVPDVGKRKVAYIFNTLEDVKKNLGIPYAFVVDGVVPAAYEHKSRRVPVTNEEEGIYDERIQIEAEPGAKVGLYLNSDAHPSHRKNPVYLVTVDEYDVEVTIIEKAGKHSDADTPTLSASDKEKKLDSYTAPLTGDIWMKISHKYIPDEVESLLPAGTDTEIKAAVKSIYEGLKQQKLTITIPATTTKPESKIEVTFSDSNNPKNNIVTYSLLTDGLPRVHPGGYAALFNAAAEAGISSLFLSSAWRPVLGSIAHRAGLGLDVSCVGSTQMNRQELRDATAVDTTNVSDEEKKLFEEFEAAKSEETTAQKTAKKAQESYEAAKTKEQRAQQTAEKFKDAYTKVKDDAVKGPAKKKMLEEKEEEAKKAIEERESAEKAWEKKEAAAQKATEEREKAEKAWNDERDKNEPESLSKFRAALMASPSVYQLFDPWFMDSNTRDAVEAKANLQKTSNETLHAHHLHITVYEPKIL